MILLCLNACGQKHIQKQKQKKDDKHLKHKIQSQTLFGQASFYNDKFNGRKTASGEKFSQKKLTAACNKLPLGTKIKVTNIQNGKSVIVKVNDRLHPKMKRIVDLSKAAAKKIGLTTAGITKVKVEVIQ
jgi:rare lipoprotein A